MIGTSQLINAFGAPVCFTDTTDIFKDRSGVALYSLDYDASDTGGASGKFGEAAIFNGSSSYINLGDPTSGITTANYSISFWVNTTSTSTSYLISKYLTDGLDSTDVFRVMNLSGGTISFRTSTFGGGSARDITSTTSINDGNWHHILFTVTPSTSKLYIDGTQEGGDSTLYTAVTPSTVTRNVTVGRHDAGDNYFNGKIDQVRIFDKAISAEDVATLYAETSSTASNTNPLSEGSGVALYSLDYDASEASGYYDGTPTNVEFGVGGKINYGARFNGSSSYIDTGATLLGQTYTVSLWFNANTITSSSDGDTLYAQYDSADVGRHIVSIYNGNLRIFVGGQTVQTISTTWSTSTWTHLVVVKNSSGYEAFVNGSSIGTSSLTASIDVTENTMIGGDDGLAGYGFDGSLDQVRIFSKALDETTNGEISALYAETACVYECTTDDVNYPFSDGTNVEAYYKLDNSSEDYVGGNDGSDTNVEYRFGRFGQAAVFNGSSSKIVTTADFDGSTSGGSSISFWFKTTQTTAKTLFGSDTTQGGAGQGSTIYIGPASGSLADESISFWDFNGSTTSVFYAKGGSTYYQDGNWHHCTIISTSSSKQIWIDGQSQTVYYFSSGSASANAKLTDIIIGDDDTGGGYNFDGSLDQVRIYNTALDSTDVSNLYAETVSDTSTLSFPSGKTAIATYQLDGNSTDLSGNYNGTDTNVTYAYDGTESNITYEFGRFGQAAVFNGSSSYITSNSLPSIGTGDFTFSCWFNQNSGNSQGALFSTTTQWFAANGYDGKVLMVTDDAVTKKGDATYGQDTWNHAVFARESGVLKIYQNGIEVFSGAYTDSWDMTQFGIGVARAFGSRVYYFNGKIDQVRIFSSALTSSQVTELYNEKPEVDTSNFKTVLYEGNSSTQYISNVGMDLETNGGLVWLKQRNSSQNHGLFDTVRGVNSFLISNSTSNVNTRTTDTLSSFDANGFTLTPYSSDAFINYSGRTMVAWCWKGGGDAVLNEEGTIDSQVSANTEAGFSIVKYTADGSASMTVGHGLSQSPEIVISKRLDSSQDWGVYTNVSTGNNTTNWLSLNDTDAYGSGSFMTLSSTLLSAVATGAFWGQGNQIAYCWHSVAGYSKIGTYTGGGTSKRVYVDNNNDGTGTGGFKPSFVMIKASSSLGGNQAYGSWVIHDDKRAIESTDNVTNPLYANRSYQEGLRGQGSSGSGVLDLAFNDDGFTINHNGHEANGSGITYIYMAFK